MASPASSFFLRTRLHQLMLSDTNRDLTADEVLDALMHAMKGVLQKKKWASVFETPGVGIASRSDHICCSFWNGVCHR